MTKDEIREEIEDLDNEVFGAIVECCKELYCDGVPLYRWDRDMVLSRFDSALDESGG